MVDQPQDRIVSASAIIPAAPEQIYGVIADYRNGHPYILPPQFSDLFVEQGGVGAGTVIRFRMRLLGRTQTCHGTVTEPEPGSLLVETYDHPAPIVTSFQVRPASTARQSEVTISTRFPPRPGILGALELRVARWLLLPIYEQELGLLAAFAGTRANVVSIRQPGLSH